MAALFLLLVLICLRIHAAKDDRQTAYILLETALLAALIAAAAEIK